MVSSGWSVVSSQWLTDLKVLLFIIIGKNYSYFLPVFLLIFRKYFFILTNNFNWLILEGIMKLKLFILSSLVVFLISCNEKHEKNQQLQSVKDSQQVQQQLQQPQDNKVQKVIKGFEMNVIKVKRDKILHETSKSGSYKSEITVVSRSGFEFAIVIINVKRIIEGSSLKLNKIYLYDKKNKRYENKYGDEITLGQEREKTCEFIFSIPIGTALKKIELIKDTFLEIEER